MDRLKLTDLYEKFMVANTWRGFLPPQHKRTETKLLGL